MIKKIIMILFIMMMIINCGLTVFRPQEMHQVCHKDLTSYLNKSDGRKKKGPESQVEMGIEPKTPRVCSQQRANTVCAPHCQRR